MLLTNPLMHQRQAAYRRNLENILSCLKPDSRAYLCDLGCDDGNWTVRLGQVAQTAHLYGVEIVDERRLKAESAGIVAIPGNLNLPLPYSDSFFDIVHANQVIEHLCDTDSFLSEIHRILKPEGYVIISTENLASWHNVFALLLGFMPFSLTNTTMKIADLGNPMAPHTGEEFYEKQPWQHKTVFTTKGLQHLLRLHGFSVEAVRGAGYYPFGNLLSDIDPYHSAFITFKGRRA